MFCDDFVGCTKLNWCCYDFDGGSNQDSNNGGSGGYGDDDHRHHNRTRRYNFGYNIFHKLCCNPLCSTDGSGDDVF